MKSMLRVFAFWLALAGAVFAQSGDLDLAEFDQVADRARAIIDNAQASNEALTELRTRLTEWRELASSARQQVTDRVATVQSQLDALGPAPESGTSEPAETSARRQDLTTQLGEARVPLIEAESAFERANGLITEIDRLIRSRLNKALVSLGPSPLLPANWSDATAALSGFFGKVQREIRNNLAAPAIRKLAIDRLPVVIFVTIVGLALVWPWRPLRFWTARHGESLATRDQGWALLARSIFALFLPFLGVTLIDFAWQRTGLLGASGASLLAALPLAALAVNCGIRMGWILRLELPRFRDNDKDPQRFHRFSIVVGIGIAVAHVISRLNGEGLDDANLSVLRFPLTLLFAVAIAALWFLAKPGRWLSMGLFANEGVAKRFTPYLRFALAVTAIAAPILGAIGYTVLAYFVTSSNLLSVALVALGFVFYRLLAYLSVGFDPISTSETEPQRNNGVLIRFGLGLAVTLVSLPFLALVWGARVTDLQEVWAQFRAGVRIGDTQISPTDVIAFLVVFAVGYAVTRIVQGTLRKTVLPNTKMDTGTQYAVVAGVGYIGIFLSAVIAISATGIDLSGLAIVAGALSVGIGFGLQNIVSNFISGIILLIERPIKEGDWIEVGGTHGTVRQISVRSTEIETFDRSIVIVPNADLVTGTMTNYTHRNLIGRVIVPVGVSYDADPERVKEILTEIAENHPKVLLNPAPFIVFQGFGASSMDFEIRAILRDVNYVLSVRSEMNFEIARRFKEEGIEIPFAQRDVNIRNVALLSEALEPSGGANDT